MKPTYTIHYVDTCNSQYFGGHHLPVVQVLVDENTTFAQIREGLLDYQTYEHLFEDEYFIVNGAAEDGFDGDIYKAAVEELYLFSKHEDVMATKPTWLQGIGSMEGEDEWDCYMYFVVESNVREESEG